jgi:hypothetical protein
MKYLITQSQLDNIIFRYLDKRGLYKLRYTNGYVFWGSKESWESGGNIIISAYRDRNEGFVSSDLLVEVATVFSLELTDSLNIIGEWVKTQIDFDIEDFLSDYGAD